MRQPAVNRVRLIGGGEYGQQIHSFEPTIAITPFIGKLKPALVAHNIAGALDRRFPVASFHFARPQVRT